MPKYVIAITDQETANFIGRHFNEGVIPRVEGDPPYSYYVISEDNETPNMIVGPDVYLNMMAGNYSPYGIVIERI